MSDYKSKKVVGTADVDRLKENISQMMNCFGKSSSGASSYEQCNFRHRKVHDLKRRDADLKSLVTSRTRKMRVDVNDVPLEVPPLQPPPPPQPGVPIVRRLANVVAFRIRKIESPHKRVVNNY